jgi:hypothetical protein
MTGRARLNFTIFTLAVVGTGWLGVAVDRAAGTETATGTATSSGSGTTGMLFFLLGPLVAVPLLHFCPVTAADRSASRRGPDSAGTPSPRSSPPWSPRSRSDSARPPVTSRSTTGPASWPRWRASSPSS